MNFFRSLGGFFSKQSKNKYPVQHVEGADKWMIDSSVLCCPVCYDVYDKVPLVLTCGHTFCRKCLQRMPLTRNSESHSLLSCPLCRVDAPLTRSIPNYIVEDLLKTVEDIVQEASPEVLNANLRAMKDRLQQRVSELESENSKLERLRREDQKRLSQMQTMILIGAPLLVYYIFKTLRALIFGW